MLIVLSGGFTGERVSSWENARLIFQSLQQNEIEARLDWLGPNGHRFGVSPLEDPVSRNAVGSGDLDPQRARDVISGYASGLRRKDTILPSLYGLYIEDGGLTSMLRRKGSSWSFSGASASKILYNKYLFRSRVARLGLTQPYFLLLNKKDDKGSLVEHVTYFRSRVRTEKIIVKPVYGGTSCGISVAETSDYYATLGAIQRAFDEYPDVIIEEFIPRTKELTISFIGCEASGRLLHSVCELRYNAAFFDEKVKISRAWQSTPCDDDQLVSEIVSAAELVLTGLFIKGALRIDVIVNEFNSPVLIECDTVPSVSIKSACFESFSMQGMSYYEFLTHIISAGAASGLGSGPINMSC